MSSKGVRSPLSKATALNKRSMSGWTLLVISTHHPPMPLSNLRHSPCPKDWPMRTTSAGAFAFSFPVGYDQFEAFSEDWRAGKEWDGDFIQCILGHHGLAAHSPLSPSNRPLSAASSQHLLSAPPLEVPMVSRCYQPQEPSTVLCSFL